MRQIGWLSQQYPPEGASAGEGIRNQLGRPELDLLTVLIREAAQNSWDARRDGQIVDFQLELSTVGPAHASHWRDLLLRSAPLDEHLPLRSSLGTPLIHTLTVSDRGTTGLGGPTRADEAVGDGRDFVAFVRNAGEPRDKAFGGGTYGFGKGIFYLVSQSGTVLVHTRCRVNGGFQTRLIGCSLWNSYTLVRPTSRVPYTGRHWWGVCGDDGVVEPIVGADADQVARMLGLELFGPEETGTTVVIVDPTLEDRTPAEAAHYLAETITWHLWPKLLPDDDGKVPMRFAVREQNVDVPVPDPRVTSPIDIFVEAYKESKKPDARRLSCLRPKRELGRLGLAKQITLPTPASAAAAIAGLDRGIHHVCLMRPAELVVRYWAGPKPLSENLSYAGVFRADPSLDHVYAKSEPPTHDNWIADQLDGTEGTYVRTTFQRIREALDEYNTAGAAIRSGGLEIPLGAASSKFSDLVAGVWGAGGGTDYGAGNISKQSDKINAESGTNPPTAHPPTAAADGGVSEVVPSPGQRLYPGEPAVTQPGSEGDARSSGNDPGVVKGSADELEAARPHRPSLKPFLQYEGDPRLDRFNSEVVIVQAFTLPAAGAQTVRASLHVVVAGATNGRETQAPAAAAVPTVLGWRSDNGRFVSDQSAEIEGGDGCTWQVIVRPAPDTITEIDLHVTARK